MWPTYCAVTQDDIVDISHVSTKGGRALTRSLSLFVYVHCSCQYAKTVLQMVVVSIKNDILFKQSEISTTFPAQKLVFNFNIACRFDKF